jgi:hypothetical protein
MYTPVALVPGRLRLLTRPDAIGSAPLAKTIGVFQRLAECLHQLRVKGLAVEKSDHWHRRLLRPRRERPAGSGAADERDELAPFHSLPAPLVASPKA